MTQEEIRQQYKSNRLGASLLYASIQEDLDRLLYELKQLQDKCEHPDLQEVIDYDGDYWECPDCHYTEG